MGSFPYAICVDASVRWDLPDIEAKVARTLLGRGYAVRGYLEGEILSDRAIAPEDIAFIEQHRWLGSPIRLEAGTPV